MTSILRLARWHPACQVLGPGVRFTCWVQGCSLACPGCVSADTHDPASGATVPVASLLDRIKSAPGSEGITISGGEPFQQAAAVAELVEGARALGLGSVVYTGYRHEALLGDPDRERLLRSTDLLIDGPFQVHTAAPLRWRGSRNQRLIPLTDRYRDLCSQAEDQPPRAQLQAAISPSGQVWWMGIPGPGTPMTNASGV